MFSFLCIFLKFSELLSIRDCIVLYLSISIALLTAWAFQKCARSQHWYCVRVNTPKRYRQLQVKDLPKVLTWWLERDSNPRPSSRKASTLPMWHHVLHAMRWCYSRECSGKKNLFLWQLPCHKADRIFDLLGINRSSTCLWYEGNIFRVSADERWLCRRANAVLWKPMPWFCPAIRLTEILICSAWIALCTGLWYENPGYVLITEISMATSAVNNKW